MYESYQPLLRHSKPVLVFLALLSILLHGGTSVGNKCLLHGLPHSQTQKLVRAVLPPLSRRCTWKRKWSHSHKSMKRTMNHKHEKLFIYHHNIRILFCIKCHLLDYLYVHFLFLILLLFMWPSLMFYLLATSACISHFVPETQQMTEINGVAHYNW